MKNNNNYISFTGPRDLGKKITDAQYKFEGDEYEKIYKNNLKQELKELDECVKNMTIEQKIESVLRHRPAWKEEGKLMTFDDWKASPVLLDIVFGDLVAELKSWYFFKNRYL